MDACDGRTKGIREELDKEEVWKKQRIYSMEKACKEVAYPMSDLGKLREKSKKREEHRKACIKEQASQFIDDGDMLALSGLEILTPQEEHMAENSISRDLEHFKKDVLHMQDQLKKLTKMVDNISGALNSFEKTFNSLNNTKALDKIA